METQQKILGFTATVPRGDWNASTSYNQLNLVRHKTASFYSKVNNNQGIEPFVTQGWEDAWQVCALDGDKQLGVDATVLVNQTTGEASAVVTRSFDSDGNPVFNFVFNGIKGERGESGTSVNIVSGRYYDPSLTYPSSIPTTGLTPLPSFASTAQGEAYVVDDNVIKGQVDLYFHGVNGANWTIIDDWGGIPGQAATVEVGTVTTLPAGSQATVQNVGTQYAARLNFGIPQGVQGEQGQQILYSTTGQNTDGAMTQKATTDEFLHDRNLLGAFDTISADGTTITRQTGRYTVDSDFLQGLLPNGPSKNLWFVRNPSDFIPNLEKETMFYPSTLGENSVEYSKTYNVLYFGKHFDSLEEAKVGLVGVEFQYKLATSYTEPAYNYLQQLYTKRNGEVLTEIADKSANLFDDSLVGYYTGTNSTQFSNAPVYLPIGTYTLSANCISFQVFIADEDGTIVSPADNSKGYVTFTLTRPATKILQFYANTASYPFTENKIKIMLNKGSVALPYQPYTGGVAYKNEVKYPFKNITQYRSDKAPYGNDVIGKIVLPSVSPSVLGIVTASTGREGLTMIRFDNSEEATVTFYKGGSGYTGYLTVYE